MVRPLDRVLAFLKARPGLLAAAIATCVLARWILKPVLDRCGHPAATLDDAYIHFQYARAIADGHPFHFQPGEPASSGGTSMLWPLALAVFYKIGFRGESIVWAAWILSFLAYGALAVETYHLTEKLAGKWHALGASVMVLAFGGFHWFVASGMEVLPFAWAMARTARLASEWAESPEARTPKARRWLVAMAWITALVRPEGAVFALGVGAVLAGFPIDPEGARTLAKTWKERARAAFALAAPAATPLMLKLVTGDAQSTTARVKLLAGSPYQDAVAGTLANVQLFYGKLLNGEVWSAEFLPKAGAPIALGALVAIAASGWRRKKVVRALFVLAIAIGMLIPCTYVTFLWNRLRYLWPFATGWLVGLACMGDLLGDAIASVRPRLRAASLVLTGTFVGLFASHHEWIVDDVANSASGIDRQQVTLGKWAKENLPADVRIGVNDTGAIAYFSDRRTFDVVGLTTQSEGKYWVAGAGSRLEHYERLQRTTPAALPTHFIVYPEWMACEPVLGKMLHEAVVTDSSILGGQAMRVFVARWDLMGSGEAPWTPMPKVADALDVADLESEAEHGYLLLGAHENEQTAYEGESPAGAPVVDGGRTRRVQERFLAKLAPGRPHTMIARVSAEAGRAKIEVKAAGKPAGAKEIEGSAWREITFEIPADAASERTIVDVTSDAALTTFHYWFD